MCNVIARIVCQRVMCENNNVSERIPALCVAVIFGSRSGGNGVLCAGDRQRRQHIREKALRMTYVWPATFSMAWRWRQA